MKREAKLLLDKACDSLLLSIEFFNRPHDLGRVTLTLILLDHAFEMLLKASIVQRGGRIREKRANETIGYDTCVRKALSDGNIKFLNDDQALTLQTINALRDAAQHHLLDISENQLYIHAQAGLTLFRDILKNVFVRELYDMLPQRVLPVSTSAPTDLVMLFDFEVDEIVKLLHPGSRRKLLAYTKLRPLMILDASLKGEKGQPSPRNIERIGKKLASGKSWQELFPGVAAVQISTEGSGVNFSLRLTKKEGIPVQLVPEGTPGASVVGVKRVNELDYYSLSLNQLAHLVRLTPPKTTAMVRYLQIEEDTNYFKPILMGKSLYKRYSQKAKEHIDEALGTISVEDVWKMHRPRQKKSS
jgi:hypothetical protein